MAHTIVIFGASGDLTSRKLIPALYRLFQKKRLPEPTRIVGFSRTKMSDEQWREKLASTTQEFLGDRFDRKTWDAFAPSIHYHPGDLTEVEDVGSLGQYLGELEEGSPTERIYYLSMSPKFYETAVECLGKQGMASESNGARRMIIEKPFGTDLKTARALNTSIHRVFHEHQVYRIDHYLGKETVNNLLVLRFANTIFEPIWNRNYIDHVQITAAESGEIGRRAAFYETAGILRDMFQNHLMQLLTLTTMEPPSRFEAKEVRDEKVKVLRAIRAMTPEQILKHTLRGQYRSYRNCEGVAPGSRTATFGAVKLRIDNWRWRGVPFYLRSGKAMSCRTTQILIQFRQPPHMMFRGGPELPHDANRLLLQLQPAEGIQLYFQTKIPDTEMQMRMTELNFNFNESFRGELPEAYERLLLDAMQGDASLFARSDEVEAAWSLVDPIQQTWDENPNDPEFYESGSWGPTAAGNWIRQDGRFWFDACPVLT